MRLSSVATIVCLAHGVASVHYARPAAPRCALAMGRAEKRAAQKRAKKDGVTVRQRNAAPDVLPKDTVAKRLGAVPVFGLLTPGIGFAKQGGETIFYMDAREAERQCAKQDGIYQVSGVPLDEVYFDATTRLKPSDDALREAPKVPPERALCSPVNTPLFAIDGFQSSDKETGVSCLPLFFSRKELLDFATPVYGGEAAAAEKILITDLEVVVNNMLNGPAGLLRDASFFADNRALMAMDRLQAGGTQTGASSSLFPTTADVPKESGVFPGMGSMPGGLDQIFGGKKMPWD